MLNIIFKCLFSMLENVLLVGIFSLMKGVGFEFNIGQHNMHNTLNDFFFFCKTWRIAQHSFMQNHAWHRKSPKICLIKIIKGYLTFHFTSLMSMMLRDQKKLNLSYHFAFYFFSWPFGRIFFITMTTWLFIFLFIRC